MQVTYFFRKQTHGFHSIETLFSAIRNALPESVSHKAHFVRFKSAMPFAVLLNGILARFAGGEINHITGDINYLALFLNPKRTVLTIHDIEILKRSKGLKKFIIKLFWFEIPIKKAKYVTVISEFTKRELLNEIKTDSSKIIVIPNCLTIHTKPFNYLFNSLKPNILQIGTKPNKNIETLIAALENIPCKLTIIGKLSEKQVQLLVNTNIEYENLSNLSSSEIINAYQHTDLVSFISTYEGFGLPILEANVVGRPVLASNTAAIPEVAGNSALYVNPFDVNSVRNGIKRLIENPAEREQIIKNGFINIQRFSPQIIANQYIALYETIVKESVA